MAYLILNKGSSSMKISLFDEKLNRIGEYSTLDQVTAKPKLIGHRVVHGGSKFLQPTLITPDVETELQKLSELAPLHNPPSLEGIELAKRKFPGIPQYAVFDTAFHATISEKAALYPIPLDLSKKYAIKRYGFHGISHAYLSKKYFEQNPTHTKLITLHLGSGCSIAAIYRGKSVDTSMGFTPLDGIMMATRCGTLDPAIVAYLCEKEHKTPDEIIALLNHESGLKGIAGTSSMEEILKQKNTLAIEMFVYRIVKEIGAYYLVLNGLDGLVFSGGIGENAPLIRKKVTEGLQPLLPLNIAVIPTDENLQILEEILALKHVSQILGEV